jgi:hypothetical protein
MPAGSAALAGELALATDPDSAELEPAAADLEPDSSEPTESSPAAAAQAEPVAARVDFAPLALAEPEPAAPVLHAGLDDVVPADPSPSRLELAHSGPSESEVADPSIEPETAEEPEPESTREPAGVEPWYRKPRPDPVSVEVESDLCTRVTAYTGFARELVRWPRRRRYQP